MNFFLVCEFFGIWHFEIGMKCISGSALGLPDMPNNIHTWINVVYLDLLRSVLLTIVPSMVTPFLMW